MAKAGGKTTTWISYSQATALASEYLGDPDFVEREIRRGLATGEIPCQWAHFEAPEGYSGPGPGDPEFWKFEGQQCTRDGAVEIRTWREIHIEGNSAIRTDGAAVRGIKLGRSALVRLKLLPPDDVDDVDDDTPAKVRPPAPRHLYGKNESGRRWSAYCWRSLNVSETATSTESRTLMFDKKWGTTCSPKPRRASRSRIGVR